MLDQLLAELTRYGSPALFVVVAVAAVGVPLPVNLLLIVTGSLVEQGRAGAWQAIVIASAGSVLGDQIGYSIGRWGGKSVVWRFTRMLGGAEQIEQFDVKAQRWGGAGVFFSRWLVTPLGPWINLASGVAGYPWLRFTLWDVIGELLGAGLYIWLGSVFSDRVQQLGTISGDLGWAVIGIVVAIFIGWKLFSARGQ